MFRCYSYTIITERINALPDVNFNIFLRQLTSASVGE